MTVRENMVMIPGLLEACVLTGCDSVAAYYCIGKRTTLKVLKSKLEYRAQTFTEFQNVETTAHDKT